MKIEVKLDEEYLEPKVVIFTDEITEEVSALLKKLEEKEPWLLAGFRQGAAEILEPSQIFCCRAENGKIYARTEKGEYALRLRLYALEERLEKKSFVRISHSELVNLKKVKRFDFSGTGTICVELLDGSVTWVSRRYVSKIKQMLGL
ncbi:MAG: LytTR family DNA-binding domain-containing protein [Oscillospiraceae bacterium]|nr:LytTR family DNA-binding domain-containing protein [Oscillospiraceae bacterium]